ncbi:ArsR/SmtB family transcription factor [Nocardia cerradoensis]|uniref:ArsR/SmtB family transcription factor n=1 Tax=Nocardia cerradoensis TaxID=85688 RepID=UPI000584EE16|nr:metalloregulator ArsR/SmtB family transcription factor [Nocardia cerradoensis]NKY42209.1 winged helix-turn-helix transcriptional regulator [Nocardia cerradoensis]
MSNQELPSAAMAGCVTTPRVRPVVGAEAAHDLAAMFKALGDPVRLRVLSAIAARAGGEACVCDISDGLDVTQPTISHHLKVLREAGLVTGERRASWVYYRVIPEALQRLSDLLADQAGLGVHT